MPPRLGTARQRVADFDPSPASKDGLHWAPAVAPRHSRLLQATIVLAADSLRGWLPGHLVDSHPTHQAEPPRRSACWA